MRCVLCGKYFPPPRRPSSSPNFWPSPSQEGWPKTWVDFCTLSATLVREMSVGRQLQKCTRRRGYGAAPVPADENRFLAPAGRRATAQQRETRTDGRGRNVHGGWREPALRKISEFRGLTQPAATQALRALHFFLRTTHQNNQDKLNGRKHRTRNQFEVHSSSIATIRHKKAQISRPKTLFLGEATAHEFLCLFVPFRGHPKKTLHRKFVKPCSQDTIWF